MGSKALQAMAVRPDSQSRPLACLRQWEARARDPPASPSLMPKALLADPSVRRAGPARRTALPQLKTSSPAEQPRLRWAGRKETGKPTMLFGESHLPS